MERHYDVLFINLIIFPLSMYACMISVSVYCSTRTRTNTLDDEWSKISCLSKDER